MSLAPFGKSNAAGALQPTRSISDAPAISGPEESMRDKPTPWWGAERTTWGGLKAL